MLAKIYKITNIYNDKIYVGYTTSTLDRRFNQHIRYPNPKSKIGRAIIKYGADSFRISLICECTDTKFALNTLEPMYISMYNSYKLGYNTTLGGEGRLGYIMPQCVKDKISTSNIGKNKRQFGKRKPRSRDKIYNYDSTVHSFKHKETGQVFVGSRLEFCDAFNLANPNVFKLIKGQAKSVKKWTLNV